MNPIYKLSFNYWDEWTGARFARRENPIIKMLEYEFIRSEWSKGLTKKPEINWGTICRSNPVTGEWKELNETIYSF